jgi:hypothetical protein
MFEEISVKKYVFLSLLMISGAIVTACQSSPPQSLGFSPVQPTGASTPPQASFFDEKMYLFVNPDVAKLIEQGKYKSGLEHYTQVGQTTQRPDGEAYESFFFGTNGSDKVLGFGTGKHAHLSGIAFELVASAKDEIPLRPKSLGKGERDILIGTQTGGDEFILGSIISAVNPKAEPFYVGQGDTDYAEIQNFTPGRDSILLAGQPAQYKFEPKDGNIRIMTASGDLVAIVMGVGKLQVDATVKERGIFMMK